MDIRSDSLSLLHNMTGGAEVSENEIKKQTNEARRFGNAAMKEHSSSGNVKQALQILQPEQLLKVLESTQNAINGTGGIVRQEQKDAPQLAQPKSVVAQLSEVKNASDNITTTSQSDSGSTLEKLTKLLGRMIELNAQSSMHSLQSNVNSFNAIFESTRSAFNELSSQLIQQGENVAACQDNLSAAKNQAQEFNGKVSDAQSALSDAQERLKNLEDKALSQKPVSAELQKQIAEAKNSVITAQANLNTAQNNYNSHIGGTLAKAETALTAAKNTLQATINQSQSLTSNLSTQQTSAIEMQRKENSENAPTLAFLMALMQQLIDKNSTDELNASAKLKQKMAEAAQKDSEKKAKEYDEQVRKAEEMQKTMGCVGKILGWAITAIGFAAAAFTGGASLAFAAIGLALAVSDEIYQAVTGDSFMQKAMTPLLDYVIKPIMEFYSNIVATVLEKLGVDKNIADIIGQVYGAIVAAVGMIAASVVAGSIASKVAGAVAKKLGNNIVGKIAQSIAKSLSRAVTSNQAKMAQIANKLNTASTVLSAGNSVIKTAGDITTAAMMVEAAKVKAKLEMNTTLQAVLNEMMDRAIEVFTRQTESLKANLENISHMVDSQSQAGKFITRQMRSVAG
ncbi:type III secretion system translocon subunit SctE [Erwinia mallotivora]|uniref:Type III secretion system protein n=1 Tax=Erwinia mallotivora TaxID=69222 RepID=A0A014MER1_9GAMM|nr:type III secretion system translocon subunit SctE [Erwinia mallotivora]EXU76554.1 type III secretion system protein [Erwinia mallotivora]